MLCAIWYHLYNVKNMKNTHGEVLLLKVSLLHGYFSRFLNCGNGTKTRKASHIDVSVKIVAVFCTLFFLVHFLSIANNVAKI